MSRLFRLKITWVTLALVAVVGAVLWLQRPIATLTLDDGTKICLQKITYGKQHPFDLSDDPGEPAWLRIWHKIFRRAVSFETEAEGPVYHFSISEKRRRSNDIPPITRIHTTFFDGRPVDHRGAANSPDDEFPRPIPVMTIGPGSFFDERNKILCRPTLATNGEKIFLCDPYFDRRAPTLKIRIKAKGKWYDWELPNPIPAKAWPEWNPDPLPIEIKREELTLAVRGWRKGEVGLPELDVELRSHGKPVTYDYLRTKFEDVTGNEAWAAALSVTERAWKAKMEVYAGLEKPLNEDHQFVFRGLKVPKAGECVILDVPESLKSQRVRFLAFANAGDFAFENGKVVPPQVGKEEKISIRGRNDEWHADVSTDRCVIVSVEGIKGNEHLAPDAKYFGIVGGEKIKGEVQAETDESDRVRYSAPLRYEVRTISFPQELKAGTSLDIMAIWPEVFRQEFYIKPPAVGM